MLRASELESRQSGAGSSVKKVLDAPRLGIGIKAKLAHRMTDEALGCSAPRNWNQGKARDAYENLKSKMLRASELESRQSPTTAMLSLTPDAPRLGIGIKAKPATGR